MSKESPDRVELHGYSVKIRLRERKLNSRNRNYPFKKPFELGNEVAKIPFEPGLKTTLFFQIGN